MMVTASEMTAFLRHFADAYAAWMQPLNRRYQLPANGLDILLFLANNPGKDTAKDICSYRHLKPGLISLTVEKLVQAGYLERKSVPGDRRKDRLLCTSAADEIIRTGRKHQEAFAQRFNQDLTEELIYNLLFAVLPQNNAEIRFTFSYAEKLDQSKLVFEAPGIPADIAGYIKDEISEKLIRGNSQSLEAEPGKLTVIQ